MKRRRPQSGLRCEGERAVGVAGRGSSTRAAWSLLSLVLILALASCRTPEVAGIQAVQFTDYADVPVPATMQRDREHSLRLESPAVGSVVNVYRGGGLNAEALTEHFLTQMPPLGWRLLSRFEQESTILVFEKDRTLCLLGIGLDRGTTTLSVLVGTVAGAEVPPVIQRN